MSARVTFLSFVQILHILWTPSGGGALGLQLGFPARQGRICRPAITRAILKLLSVMFGQVGHVDDVLNSIAQQNDKEVIDM